MSQLSRKKPQPDFQVIASMSNPTSHRRKDDSQKESIFIKEISQNHHRWSSFSRSLNKRNDDFCFFLVSSSEREKKKTEQTLLDWLLKRMILIHLCTCVTVRHMYKTRSIEKRFFFVICRCRSVDTMRSDRFLLEDKQIESCTSAVKTRSANRKKMHFRARGERREKISAWFIESKKRISRAFAISSFVDMPDFEQ